LPPSSSSAVGTVTPRVHAGKISNGAEAPESKPHTSRAFSRKAISHEVNSPKEKALESVRLAVWIVL
jgi:hypothetical protein